MGIFSIFKKKEKTDFEGMRETMKKTGFTQDPKKPNKYGIIRLNLKTIEDFRVKRFFGQIPTPINVVIKQFIRLGLNTEEVERLREYSRQYTLFLSKKSDDETNNIADNFVKESNKIILKLETIEEEQKKQNI